MNVIKPFTWLNEKEKGAVLSPPMLIQTFAAITDSSKMLSTLDYDAGDAHNCFPLLDFPSSTALHRESQCPWKELRFEIGSFNTVLSVCKFDSHFLKAD